MASSRVQRLASTGAPVAWHEGTLENLSRAHKCQTNADTNTNKSIASHETTRFEQDQQSFTVHRRLVVKVGHTRRLAERLQERIASVDRCLGLTRYSLKDLEVAFEAKNAPLQLNSWRQNRRAERPNRELVRDSLAGALEEEKQTLTNAQKQLRRSIRKSEKMILSLEQVLGCLQEDHQRKRDAFRIDRQCIDTSSSWNGSMLPNGDDPTLPTSRPQTPVSEGAATGMSMRTARSLASNYSTPFEEAENNRQFETIQLTNKGKKKEVEADTLRDENTELIRHSQVQCTTALKAVETRLAERAEETLVMSQRIEKAIEITDSKIEKTKRCLARTAAEIRSFEQPIDVAGVRQRLRQTRPRQERVKDEVSDALSNQFTSLRNSMAALESRHKEEKDAVSRLEEAKSKLNADLQDKMTALRIERSIMPTAKGALAKVLASPGAPLTARRSPRKAPRPGATHKMPLTAR